MSVVLLRLCLVGALTCPALVLGGEQDDDSEVRSSLAQRIEDLRHELEFAQETDNKAEVREILELLSSFGAEAGEPENTLPTGPLVAPGQFQTLGSYGLNILRWKPPPIRNLKGVQIERTIGEKHDWFVVANLPASQRQWLDENVVPGERNSYRIRSVGPVGEFSDFAPVRSAISRNADESSLPVYSLRLPPHGMQAMLADVTENIEVEGQLFFEGREYAVRVRLRGASTRHAAKKSYRLQLLEATPFSRRVTNLKAEPMDHTMQQEKLSCDLFRAAGLWVSDTRYVNLFINGRYEGVYLDIEPIRSPFKKNPGLDPKGTLIRANTFQHLDGWRGPGKIRGKTGSLQELSEFISNINYVERGKFEEFIRRETDWPRLRDYLAVQILCHRSEIEANDYFYYRDPGSKKWSLIPWDHNNGNFEVSPYGNRIHEPSIHLFSQCIQDVGWRPEHWFVLPSRIFNNETLRSEFLDRLRGLCEDLLLSGRAAQLVDHNFDMLRKEYPVDPYRTPFEAEDPFLGSNTHLRQFLRDHARRILNQIETLQKPTLDRLVVNEFKFGSKSGWVEIHNPTDRPVPLAGYSLVTKNDSGNWKLSMREGATLPPGEYHVVDFPFHERTESKVDDPEEEERWRLHRQETAFPGMDPDGGFFAWVRASEMGPSNNEHENHETVIDFFFYGVQPKSLSYGRLDRVFTWLTPTPGAPNRGEAFH